MIIHNPILTGSFTVNGTDVASITSSAASITAINSYTASQDILNGTYATTGSNTFAGIQTINSNLTVTGSITAATLVVQTITSSVIYSSGSNVFGNNIANTQVLTGSVTVTGSFRFGSSNQQTAGSERIYVGQNSAVGIDDANSLSLSVAHAPATGSPTISFTYQFRTNDNAGGNLYGDAIKVVKNAGASSTYTVFTTNSTIGAGTERMRIDSSGNIGIGNTNPQLKLDIRAGSLGIYHNTTGTNGAQIYLGDSNFQGGSYATSAPGIGAVYSSLSGVASDLGFYVYTGVEASRTERMRITSGGIFCFGTATTSQTSLFTAKAAATSTTWSFGPNTFNSADIFRIETYATTGVYLTAGNTSWTANSDERLKNITVNISNAVDALNTLRTVKYSWKKDDTNKIHLGLIAQDVIKVLPEIVDINDDEDKTLGVKYTEMIPVLVKAIQELKSQNDDLQAQITELKNK
jgi:hypothetical protein